MMRVRVRVGPSPIHGLGVFATERIPAGTVVWEWSPGWDVLVPPEGVRNAAGLDREHMVTYGWRDGDCWRIPLDDGRFVNHSVHPNCAASPGVGHSVAIRDIEPGEELLEDYGSFDPDFEGY